MAISQVRAQVNGMWHTLTYNGQTGAYEAQIQAPAATSYNQPGGYYNVTVEATNTAGSVTQASGADLPGLQLVVKETVAPVITMVSPTSGAYVTNASVPVIFTVTDEAGGSGVDPDTLAVTLDSSPVSSSEITYQAITNGYQFTYTPASGLSNASHTVTVNISDHDGNAATEKSVTFTVDTVKPVLNVTSPADNLLTNNASLTVAGTTNDATSSPVTVTIVLNNQDQGAVTVESSGAFSKQVTLTEGTNTLVITATDTAGNATVVNRTVGLDTSVPTIASASITPNPVDAGQTMLISVVIT